MSLSLEKRVAALEQQVADLKAKQMNHPEKDWRRTVGQFPQLQEVFDEAMKLREEDRKKFRKATKQTRAKKS